MEHFRHILAGWLVDGSGSPVRQDVLLSWEGSTLTCVRSAEPGEPAKTPTEDFRTFTVLPGLVDAHVHLSFSGTDDPVQRKGQFSLSYAQTETRIEHHITRHIGHGVVAVRDGGDRRAYALRYKSTRKGEGRPPVALKAPGQAWHAPGRYGSLIGRVPGETLAVAVAGAGAGRDHIKIVNSGLNSLTRFGAETSPQFSLEELRNAVSAAHTLGLAVMVHANGRVPVALAVKAGCDSIEHGFFMGKENLRNMAERGVSWVPTAFTMAAYVRRLPAGSVESDVARRNLDHQLDQIRSARELGVRVVTGTDSGSLGVYHGESLFEEMRLLHAAGFSLEEAVGCASSRGAALLGVEGHTGVLSPGHPAPFVAFKGEPRSVLEHPKQPDLVVVKGNIFRDDRPFRTGRKDR